MAKQVLALNRLAAQMEHKGQSNSALLIRQAGERIERLEQVLIDWILEDEEHSHE